jgi:hypothetical protein
LISSLLPDCCLSYLPGVITFHVGSHNRDVHSLISSSLGLYGILVPGLPHKTLALRTVLSIAIRLVALSPYCRPARIRMNCSLYVSQRIKGRMEMVKWKIQEAISLTVRSHRRHPHHPVTPFVSLRACSRHSRF